MNLLQKLDARKDRHAKNPSKWDALDDFTEIINRIRREKK